MTTQQVCGAAFVTHWHDIASRLTHLKRFLLRQCSFIPISRGSWWRWRDHRVLLRIHQRLFNRSIMGIGVHLKDWLFLRRHGHTVIDLGCNLSSCSLTSAIFDGNLLVLVD